MKGVMMMCGRYIFLDQDNIEMHSRLKQLQKLFTAKELQDVALNEVFPSMKTPVYTLQNDELIPQIMRFGYTGFNGKGLLINARCETVKEKPTFKDDFNHRRCVIIASGYYEWDKQKVKHLFKKQNAPIYMAGIYNRQNQMVILTRKAHDQSALIHERCPLILTTDQAIQYCGFTLKGQFPAPKLLISEC